MWEFRNRNVFGATAFSTYGGFWIGLFLWVQFVAPHAASASAADHDLGWILLAFAIFNTYMLIMSRAGEHGGLRGVPDPGAHRDHPGHRVTSRAASAIVKLGGYVGIITALCAWYTSAAGVSNGLNGRLRLPVGKPLI